jgi:hypothetical protein
LWFQRPTSLCHRSSSQIDKHESPALVEAQRVHIIVGSDDHDCLEPFGARSIRKCIDQPRPDVLTPGEGFEGKDFPDARLEVTETQETLSLSGDQSRKAHKVDQLPS